MAAADWEHALNAYEVLGLVQGPKATDAEIGKVGSLLAGGNPLGHDIFGVQTCVHGLNCGCRSSCS